MKMNGQACNFHFLSLKLLSDFKCVSMSRINKESTSYNDHKIPRILCLVDYNLGSNLMQCIEHPPEYIELPSRCCWTRVPLWDYSLTNDHVIWVDGRPGSPSLLEPTLLGNKPYWCKQGLGLARLVNKSQMCLNSPYRL